MTAGGKTLAIFPKKLHLSWLLLMHYREIIPRKNGTLRQTLGNTEGTFNTTRKRGGRGKKD